MTDLYVKGGASFSIPSNVYVKNTSNVWVPSQKVFRKNGTTGGPANDGWIKHWPPALPFSATTTTTNMGLVGAGPLANGGSWGISTLSIPPAAFGANKIVHITALNFYLYVVTYYAQDGDAWGYRGIGMTGQYKTLTNTRGIYTGSNSFTGYATSPFTYTGYQYPTISGTPGISIPLGYVLTGIEFWELADIENGGWRSSMQYRLIIAPLKNADGSNVATGDVSFGTAATQSIVSNAGWDGGGWYGGSGITLPVGNTIQQVTMGHGLSRGGSSFGAILTSAPTTIL
jgi:hypothetical protein